MIVELEYRDGGNYKVYFDAVVPKELEREIELNKEFEIEKFNLDPEDIYAKRDYPFDPELDHNLVDVVRIYSENQEQFMNDAKKASFQIQPYTSKETKGEQYPSVHVDGPNEFVTKAEYNQDTLGYGLILYVSE